MEYPPSCCEIPKSVEQTGERAVNVNELIAIDVHTQAEEPCGTHPDDGYDELQAAMAVYFNQPDNRPTIEGPRATTASARLAR